MEKILLILALLLISFNGINAQSIKGVGKITLDMTLKEAQAAFPNKLTKQKTSTDVKKVYKMSSYTPVKDCTLKDIYMYFYCDTLYAIYINDAMEIKKPFISKYGEPSSYFRRIKSYVEERIAIYDSDATDFIDYSKSSSYGFEETFYTWKNSNPFIVTKYVEGTYYVNDQDLDFMGILVIKNQAHAKCVELETEKREEQRKQERLKELEDL